MGNPVKEELKSHHQKLHRGVFFSCSFICNEEHENLANNYSYRSDFLTLLLNHSLR